MVCRFHDLRAPDDSYSGRSRNPHPAREPHPPRSMGVLSRSRRDLCPKPRSLQDQVAPEKDRSGPGDPGSAANSVRSPSQVAAVAFPVPLQHRCRLDQHQSAALPTPVSAQTQARALGQPAGGAAWAAPAEAQRVDGERWRSRPPKKRGLEPCLCGRGGPEGPMISSSLGPKRKATKSIAVGRMRFSGSTGVGGRLRVRKSGRLRVRKE